MQASKVKAIRAIWPNAGIRQRYQRRMTALIREMADSVEYWLQAQRKAAPPVLAQDSTPAEQMQFEFRKLAERWQGKFDDMAPKVAASFLKNQFRGTSAAMRMALREAGWSIEFTLTPAMRDALEASLAENVGLIRSIPAQYLQEVEGIVMRNYAAGRDLKSMAAEIRARYHVAANRAVLISRDQSNKANAVVQRARQTELGIVEAQWLHSHAGKTPRPTHVAMNGKRYLISKGMYDSAVKKWIFPGELIGCFPEDSEVQFADYVSKAYRRFYSGELAEIVTDSGKMVRATPNHPILTPNGWVAIGALNEGDNIFCVPDDRFRAEGFMPPRTTIGEKNKDGAVPTFAEIFRSLAQADSVRYAEVSHAANFHGDGRSNGNVDVVFSARTLRFGRKTRTSKQFKQFALTMAYEAATAFRAPIQLICRAFNTAHSIVSRFGKPLSSLYSFAFHADTVCIAPSANCSSGKDDSANNRTSSDSIFSREREHARAVLMFFPNTERIVRVGSVPYRGYVCNLETQHGFYLTGNIIAHNCRCQGRSVLPWTPAERR